MNRNVRTNPMLLERLEIFQHGNPVQNHAMNVGCAPVWAGGQTAGAQGRRLTRAGCRKAFRESKSGAKTNGPQHERAVAQLAAGDASKMTRLDHLAGRLMVAVPVGPTDVEQDLIRTRTAEGRSCAKARGQRMGRPLKLTPQQQKEARRRRAEGATLKELAKTYNVGRATISRLSP